MAAETAVDGTAVDPAVISLLPRGHKAVQQHEQTCADQYRAEGHRQVRLHAVEVVPHCRAGRVHRQMYRHAEGARERTAREGQRVLESQWAPVLARSSATAMISPASHKWARRPRLTLAPTVVGGALFALLACCPIGFLESLLPNQDSLRPLAVIYLLREVSWEPPIPLEL